MSPEEMAARIDALELGFVRLIAFLEDGRGAERREIAASMRRMATDLQALKATEMQSSGRALDRLAEMVATRDPAG